MKIELKVPNTTPNVIANANGWMLLPPRKRMHNNTINVERDVLMVRARVWFIESLNTLLYI